MSTTVNWEGELRCLRCRAARDMPIVPAPMRVMLRLCLLIVPSEMRSRLVHFHAGRLSSKIYTIFKCGISVRSAKERS